MTFAPRSRASITHWKPTGWFSAIDDPMIRMASAFFRSCCAVVAPPRPNDVPRPGTVELCHIRRLIAQAHHSQSGGKQFLDQIIFFVVERGAAEMGDGSGLHQRLAILRFLERFAPALSQTRSATMSIAVSRSISSQLREYGRRYFTRVSRPGWVCNS